jgi:hypothetical protein
MLAPYTLCRSGGDQHDTLDRIVDAYISAHRRHARAVLTYYRRRGSLQAAIEAAGMARLPSGKRHPHQYRLSRLTLEQVTSALLQNEDALRACSSFQELFELVKGIAANIHGAGPLMVYDTAHRLGAYLRLEPERVYLHSGTKEGARALGFRKREMLEMQELPKAFQRLKPYEVEDCLCIYKDDLRDVASS